MYFTLTDLSPFSAFGENTVNATPQLLDGDVTFSAPGVSFEDGQLTLTGLTADDRVSVRDQGTGTGQIGLSGSDVTYEGVVIGTLSGGQGNDLTITFAATVTAQAIEALVENLTFANVSNTPLATRTLTLNITDFFGRSLTSSDIADQTYEQRELITDAYGPNTQPNFADLDSDGDLDLVVAGEDTFQVFLNQDGIFTAVSGAASNPLQQVVDFVLAQIDADPNSAGWGVLRTAFGDLDQDGDEDMFLIRQSDGTLEYFINDGGTYSRADADFPDWGLDLGAGASLALGDLDQDGDLDAISGSSSGPLRVWINQGGTFVAGSEAQTLSGLGTQTVPALADLDGDGKLDVLVGNTAGQFSIQINFGGLSFGPGIDNPFGGLSAGTNVAPALADIDGDGDIDLLVGNSDGEVLYFENTTPITVPATLTIQVTPQNDTPTIDNVPLSATVTEGAATALDLSAIVLDDADGNVLTLEFFSILGTFAATSTAQVTAQTTVGEFGGGGLRLIGRAADIMAYLDTLGAVTFTSGAPSLPDDQGITVQVSDGFSAPGSKTITLTIAPPPFPTITGTEGKDALVGSTGAEIIKALGGDDVVRGLNGADTMDGGAGRDTLNYGSSNAGVTVDLNTDAAGNQSASGGHATGDVIRGFESIIGSSRADNLTGDGAANTLNGGGGNDTLTGNGGNDVLIGGRGADVIAGGSGNDTAVYSASASGVVIDLRADGLGQQFAALGDAEGDVLSGIENVRGSAHDDVLTGNAQRNTLQGGAGSDTFVFATALAASNADKITDFRAGQDVIALHQAIFTALSPEAWLSGQFEVNTTGLASTAGTRVIYESDTGRLYYDANGSLGGGDVLFATLSRGLALTADDFVIQGLEGLLT